MKIFQSNIEEQSSSIQALEKVLKRLSILRALSFLLSLVAIGFLANERLLIGLWLAVPLFIFGFVFLLVRYNKVNKLKETKRYLLQINKEELLRLDNQLDGFPTGTSYLSAKHAYTGDLDIFGDHSLFQLLNRTTTETGSACLAGWLAEAAPQAVILERQEAVQELKSHVEWRQKLHVAGLPFQNLENDFQALLNWMKHQEQILPKQYKYLVASILLGITATMAGAWYIGHAFTDNWMLYLLPLLLTLGVNYLFLRKVAPIAEAIIDHTHQHIKTLMGYRQLVESVLSKQFESKKLQSLQQALVQNDASAALEMGRLQKILEPFEQRGTKKHEGNKFYPLFNIFWLFDVYGIILVERWKRKNKNQMQGWIDAISEMEALNSLAGFAYAQPDFAFPAIQTVPYTIDFDQLGHPLIRSDNRICNDFQLNGSGHIAMITGSNMAGKSTFLRTVGINLVLALMGAPCCAKSGKVAPMQLFTSMRTQDKLAAGVSSFYAELKRIEQLLDMIACGTPIFFMLDEMFKGTNSQDRYKGGVSLIKQLSELNAFGIISTHDLSLAELAGEHMIVANHSFNSTIQAGKMHFDYQLTKGICTDFNASELMKKSGIKLISDLESLNSQNRRDA